jgi:ubiquinone/menaquinone biosynthesis C-methylase UbiE
MNRGGTGKEFAAFFDRRARMNNNAMNISVHNDPRVAGYYAAYEGLEDSEQYLFDKYIEKGKTILDIGVGGGRTTPFLLAAAKSYIGIDHAQAMVDICRTKFEGVQFETMGATEMSAFQDGSFDIAVFSFNGIDNINPEEARFRCLTEVRRVLKPGGLFIFSSHHAKGLLARPLLRGASAFRKVLRIGGAILRSARLAARLLRSGVFYRGYGYYLDPIFGGCFFYASTPEGVSQEAKASGFEVVEVINQYFPVHASKYFISSYYYVFVKP